MSRSRPLDWSMTKIFVTRMHSSRMRTVRCSGRGRGERCLTGECMPRVGICLGGWGVAAQRSSDQGCVWPGGVCLGGGGLTRVGAVCPRGSDQGGVCQWGCVSQRALGRGVSRLQNSWHTLVKTLPFHNYVVDGKKDCLNLQANSGSGGGAKGAVPPFRPC